MFPLAMNPLSAFLFSTAFLLQGFLYPSWISVYFPAECHTAHCDDLHLTFYLIFYSIFSIFLFLIRHFPFTEFASRVWLLTPYSQSATIHFPFYFSFYFPFFTFHFSLFTLTLHFYPSRCIALLLKENFPYLLFSNFLWRLLTGFSASLTQLWWQFFLCPRSMMASKFNGEVINHSQRHWRPLFILYSLFISSINLVLENNFIFIFIIHINLLTAFFTI